MYGQLYYFPSQCIPYAHSQHSGLTAQVRELPNRLHRLCFPYRICRYNGQHVVGPFYDRVGKPPHHLHGVGRPTQLWQNTAASPSHCPSLDVSALLFHYRLDTTRYAFHAVRWQTFPEWIFFPFLKVYPYISAMPFWNETSMPEDVLEEWEHIIRKVDGIKPPTVQEGNINSIELSFSSAAKHRLISWKNGVNSRIYSDSESETEKALCGKLETYLIRFCLIIQVMRGICGEAGMDEIDEESAQRAIWLTEYFRAMESRITPEMETGVLDLRHTELLSLLSQSFTTSEAVATGKKLGLSESTVKRFLREGAREFIRKEAHGRYCKF